MNHRFHLIGVASLCCLAYSLITGQGKSIATCTTGETIGAPAAVPEAVSIGAPAAQETTPQARFEQLARIASQRNLQDRAAADVQEARADLRLQKSPAWLAMLTTNWQPFQKLRQKAAHSPHGETPCTLCDGRGSMSFCVLCQHNGGKCLSCGGTGRTPSAGYCPTCLGKGKCYLCGGTGKMTCPFCDDGIISLKAPLPSSMLPVD